MPIFRVPIESREVVYIDVVAEDSQEASELADEWAMDNQDLVYDLLGSSNNFTGPEVGAAELYSRSEELDDTTIEQYNDYIGLAR